MPNLCVTCEHPQRRAIDDLLVAGKRSVRSIAAEFGLVPKSVGRHAANHVGPRAPRGRQTPYTAPGSAGKPNGQPAAPGSTSSSVDGEPVDIRAELTRQLESLNAMDDGSLSPTQQVNLAEARRRVTESLGKVQPPAANAPVQVRDVQGLEEIFFALHIVLDRPENARVRDEVNAALAAHREQLAGTSLAQEEA